MPKHFEKENYMGEIAIWYITIYLTSCSFFFPDMVRHQSLRCQKDDQISTAEETFFFSSLDNNFRRNRQWFRLRLQRLQHKRPLCSPRIDFCLQLFFHFYFIIFFSKVVGLNERGKWRSLYLSVFLLCYLCLSLISPFLSIHFIFHFVLIIVFFLSLLSSIASCPYYSNFFVSLFVSFRRYKSNCRILIHLFLVPSAPASSRSSCRCPTRSWWALLPPRCWRRRWELEGQRSWLLPWHSTQLSILRNS